MQIGRNLPAMEWTHLYWPDLSRASVRPKPQSGSFIYSVEPEAIGHCLTIDALVSWIKEAKMKQAKWRISEVSNSRGIGLNFQMTLKPGFSLEPEPKAKSRWEPFPHSLNQPPRGASQTVIKLPNSCSVQSNNHSWAPVLPTLADCPLPPSLLRSGSFCCVWLELSSSLWLGPLKMLPPWREKLSCVLTSSNSPYNSQR